MCCILVKHHIDHFLVIEVIKILEHEVYLLTIALFNQELNDC